MDKLATILQDIWVGLSEGTRRYDHAFHTGVLATVNNQHNQAVPAIRTVVLRNVAAEKRQLICYSDVRATKIVQIRQQAAVSWLFYDPTRKIQVRAEGLATLHHEDEIAAAEWTHTSPPNQLNYATTFAPGVPLLDPDPKLYYPSNTDAAATSRANFVVIISTISRFDWLELGTEQHVRAGFNWDGNLFAASWLVP